MTAPTFDGTASGIHSSSGDISASLTTTKPNDIVVVCVAVETTSGTAPTITAVSGPGMTFARRSQNAPFPRIRMEVWWALASAVLTGATITASFSGAYDNASLFVFGANGCNVSAPWDINGALPNNTSTSGNSVQTGSISTNKADDLLLMFVGCDANNGSNFARCPVGWTDQGISYNGGGSLFSWIGVASLTVAATQSALSVPTSSAITTSGSGIATTCDAMSSGGGAGPISSLIV